MPASISFRGLGPEDKHIAFDDEITVLRHPSGWGKTTAMLATIAAMTGEHAPLPRCVPAVIEAGLGTGRTIRLTAGKDKKWKRQVFEPNGDEKTSHLCKGDSQPTDLRTVGGWRRVMGFLADPVRAPLIMMPLEWRKYDAATLRDLLVSAEPLESIAGLKRLIDAATEGLVKESEWWRENDPTTRAKLEEAVRTARSNRDRAIGARDECQRRLTALQMKNLEDVVSEPENVIQAWEMWRQWDKNQTAWERRKRWDRWFAEHPRPARPPQDKIEELGELERAATQTRDRAQSVYDAALRLEQEAERKLSEVETAVAQQVPSDVCPTCGATGGPKLESLRTEIVEIVKRKNEELVSARELCRSASASSNEACMRWDQAEKNRQIARENLERLLREQREYMKWLDARNALGPEPKEATEPSIPECPRPSENALQEARAALKAKEQQNVLSKAREADIAAAKDLLGEAETKLLEKVKEVARLEALFDFAKKAPDDLIDRSIAAFGAQSCPALTVRIQRCDGGVEVVAQLVGEQNSRPFSTLSKGQARLADALLRAGLRALWGMKKVQIFVDDAEGWSGEYPASLVPAVLLYTEKR